MAKCMLNRLIVEVLVTLKVKFFVYKLNTVVYNNREILTRLALEEHGEKLRCTLHIREHLHTKYPELLNSAIEYTEERYWII